VTTLDPLFDILKYCRYTTGIVKCSDRSALTNMVLISLAQFLQSMLYMCKVANLATFRPFSTGLQV